MSHKTHDWCDTCGRVTDHIEGECTDCADRERMEADKGIGIRRGSPGAPEYYAGEIEKNCIKYKSPQRNDAPAAKPSWKQRLALGFLNSWPVKALGGLLDRFLGGG